MGYDAVSEERLQRVYAYTLTGNLGKSSDTLCFVLCLSVSYLSGPEALEAFFFNLKNPALWTIASMISGLSWVLL